MNQPFKASPPPLPRGRGRPKGSGRASAQGGPAHKRAPTQPGTVLVNGVATPLSTVPEALRPDRRRRVVLKPAPDAPGPAAMPSQPLDGYLPVTDLDFSRAAAATTQAMAAATYGMITEEEALRMPRWEIEFNAWCINPPNGLGRVQHFRNLCSLIWPDLREGWHPWMERRIQSLVREDFVQRVGETVIRATTWLGCAASGKTHDSGIFAMLWWAMDPANSIALLTSTTKDMLRRRVWSVIRNRYDSAVDLEGGRRVQIPGYVMESRTAIQHEKHDDKHAIFAMAVAHGETAKAVNMMKGIHAKRILLVIDEANGTPESIFRVIPNLRKGCRELNLLFIGNPTSHLDTLGMVSEPKGGWKDISVESDAWETKGVPDWQVPPGLCLHFDGYRSPNVQLGETKWPFIYSMEDYLAAKSSTEQGLEHWQNDRGFYAGEGTINTVFTEPLVERCNGFGHPLFVDECTPVAFLDPAFGGDRCVLQFGEIGTVKGGRTALVLTEVLNLNPLSKPGEEAEYVIAAQAKEACIARGVQPRHFGVDAIGTGRGVASVIATEWSPDIQKFYSNERPSAEQILVSERTADREYDRATTQHWFRARDLLEGGQLFGLYREAVVQFCSRQYKQRGRVYVLSTKAEHKESVASRESPDNADAIVGLCWVGRSLGLEPAPRWRPGQSASAAEDAADQVHDEANAYAAPEEFPE